MFTLEQFIEIFPAHTTIKLYKFSYYYTAIFLHP